MLFLKVVLVMSVYQYYCVGIPKFNQNYDNKWNSLLDGELVTDGEITTEPDDITTTTITTTTAEPDNITTTTPTLPTTTTTDSSVCPPDKSLYSKNDIKVIINFVYENLNLNKSLLEQVVPQANEINQRLSNDLNQFKDWFQSQPGHLIHVLQGLSAVRKKTIEPEAEKISVILKDYPQVKENIDGKQLRYNKLIKKLNKYDNLCKYTCDDEEPESNHIFKRSIEEERSLCMSIADLHKQIITELKENYEVFLNKIKNNLLILNETYTEKIEYIKSDLRDRALNEFGRTMYDVLKLEDEYQHFANEINSTDTQILMYTVKDAGLQIDSKLLELQRLIEDYGNYCKNCHKGPVKRFVRHTKSLENVNENSKASIVQELIRQKYNELEQNFNKTFDETFKDLSALINDPKLEETYMNIIKSKEKEIVDVKNIESQGLDHLKSIASPDSLKMLSDLDLSSKDQLKNIDEKIKHLKTIIT